MSTILNIKSKIKNNTTMNIFKLHSYIMRRVGPKTGLFPKNSERSMPCPVFITKNPSFIA